MQLLNAYDTQKHAISRLPLVEQYVFHKGFDQIGSWCISEGETKEITHKITPIFQKIDPLEKIKV